MGNPWFGDETGILCYNAGACAELASRVFHQIVYPHNFPAQQTLHLSRQTSQDIPNRTGGRWLVLFRIGNIQRQQLESPHEEGVPDRRRRGPRRVLSPPRRQARDGKKRNICHRIQPTVRRPPPDEGVPGRGDHLPDRRGREEILAVMAHSTSSSGGSLVPEELERHGKDAQGSRRGYHDQLRRGRLAVPKAEG